MLAAVLLPVLGGALLFPLQIKEPVKRMLVVMGTVLLTSMLTFFIILSKHEDMLVCFEITQRVAIAFKMDALSAVFGGLVAFLWPLAVCYAFEYMRHEGNENTFFAWYTISYGVTLGIVFSANLVTMYLFYELLTLSTLPLIMHKGDLKAMNAGRKYLIYSVTGAAFALMGIIILYRVAGSVDFVYGGRLALSGRSYSSQRDIIALGYLLTFFGFGVKAAVWPLHGWLPAAGIAPTPVTALLHAVAVVKAGVFAIMRSTWYAYGPSFIRGTWVQALVMCFACFTIVYGSWMAVREQHIKRRLAYSTVSNLSYIVFGVTLMSGEAMGAALIHMVFHGIMKICLFFCAGAVIVQSGKEYVWQINGLGKRMKTVFMCFTVSSVALIGVPGLIGFPGKWQLCTAASGAAQKMPLAWAGVAALIVSAILTAIYLFTIIIPAYFKPESKRDAQAGENSETKSLDPGPLMKIPMILLSALCVILGLFGGRLMEFLMRAGAGLTL